MVSMHMVYRYVVHNMHGLVCRYINLVYGGQLNQQFHCYVSNIHMHIPTRRVREGKIRDREVSFIR